MNPIITNLFGFDLKWYSLILFIAFIFGYFLVYREAKKFKIDQEFIFNMTFWTIIFGLIGARLYYVVFNWHLYAGNPISFLKVWEGGLAIHGGLLFGFIMIWFYCYRYKVGLLKIIDIAVPAIIIGQAIGRWGNFFNSEAHGGATTLASLEALKIIPQFVINGMKISNIYYQPLFYYESLWCILGFLVLIIVRRIKFIKNGQLTSIYLMWYSCGRFFIEIYRTDSLMLGGFKAAQIVSLILFVLGLVLFILLTRKSKYEDIYASYQIKEVRF